MALKIELYAGKFLILSHIILQQTTSGYQPSTQLTMLSCILAADFGNRSPAGVGCLRKNRPISVVPIAILLNVVSP